MPMNNDIFFNMLAISATVGILGMAFILFSRRYKMPAKWLCICHTILALRLLVPFNLPISVWNIITPTAGTPHQSGTSSSAQNVFYEKIIISAPSAGGAEVGSEAYESGFSAADSIFTAENLITAALWIWLAGAVIFILWQMAAYMHERRELLRWSRTADSNITNAAERIAEELRINQRYEILISEKAVSPMLMGGLRPIIFIPVGFDEAGLNLALRHEFTHLKRRDIWLKLLLTAANAAHWFNPTVWYIAVQAERDIESACDEQVLANADRSCRRAYCEAILDMMNNRRVPLSTAFANRKEDIMKRFERIINTNNRKGGIIAAAAVLCLSLLLSGLVGCTEAKTEPAAVNAQESAQQEQLENDVLAAQQEKETAVSTADAPKNSAGIADTANSGQEAEPEITIEYLFDIVGSEGSMNAEEAMKLINRYRTENGLPELITAAPSDGSGLYEAATVRLEESKEMFSHTRPNGEDFSTAFALVFGTDHIEILGAGHITAAQFVDAITADVDVESEQQPLGEDVTHTHISEQLLGDITHGCVVVDQDSEGQIYWIFTACKAE